jgi:hypothetical protein
LVDDQVGELTGRVAEPNDPARVVDLDGVGHVEEAALARA